VAVNAATNQIFVVDMLSSDVMVIDGNTNSTTILPLPFQEPSAVAVNPQTGIAYVTSKSTGMVAVISP
jgi:DNA-binding beta-propeller fold protein YncE